MTKVIEIVVIGGTGSGKSHVLDVIDRALRGEYGHYVQIASHDLAIERNMGSPGVEPVVSETIFSLREQGASTGKATAGEIKAGLRNCSASRDAYWAHAVGSAPVCAQVEALTAIQGEAISFSLDPLEQAIESTARVMRDEREQSAEILHTMIGEVPFSAVYRRMSTHLDDLLAAQLRRVSSDDVQTNEGA